MTVGIEKTKEIANIQTQKTSRRSKLEYPVIFVPGMAGVDHPDNWFAAIKFIEKYANAKKDMDFFTIANERNDKAVNNHRLQAEKLNRQINSLKSKKVNLVFFSNSYFTFLKYLVESGVVIKRATKAGDKVEDKYILNPAKAGKINRVILFSPSPEGSGLANLAVAVPEVIKTFLGDFDDKNINIKFNPLYKPIKIPYKPDFSPTFKNIRRESKVRPVVEKSLLVKEGEKILASLPITFREKIHLFMGSDSSNPFISTFIDGNDDGVVPHGDIFTMIKKDEAEKKEEIKEEFEEEVEEEVNEEVEIKNNVPTPNENFKGVNLFYVIKRDHGGCRELPFGVAPIFHKLLTTSRSITSRVIRPYNNGKDNNGEDIHRSTYIPITPRPEIEEWVVDGRNSEQILLTGNHGVSLDDLLYLANDENKEVRDKAWAAVKMRIEWDGEDILEELKEIVEKEGIKTKNKQILEKKAQIIKSAEKAIQSLF